MAAITYCDGWPRPGEEVRVIALERAWVELLTVLPVLAALAVTVHALLRKREVTTAAGWIALAWLSPFVGSILYVVFGINRVQRMALRLRRAGMRGRSSADERDHAPLDPALRRLHRASYRITGRNAEPGEVVAIPLGGDNAYPRMLEAIGRAEHSIALASYIFRADAVGGQFIAALAAAKERGVEVRVLIDGIGGGYFFAPAWRRLRRVGTPTARFLHSPLPWRMPFINLRNHKKLLIIDGKEAFTGGLNIGAENLSSAPPKRGVRDTHFHVAGPVVAQLVDNFREDWWFTTGERLEGPLWFPHIPPTQTMLARAISSGPDEDIGKLELVLLEALALARRSIRIASPYFLPDEQLVNALSLAALRGVQVDIVVPERSDHRVMDWAVREHIKPLIQAGCAVWAGAEPFDHSKLLSIDDRWSLIGSANWDVRSLRLNFELNVEIYDEGFARQMAALVDKGKRRRFDATALAQRGLPARLRDAAARLLLPYL